MFQIGFYAQLPERVLKEHHLGAHALEIENADWRKINLIGNSGQEILAAPAFADERHHFLSAAFETSSAIRSSISFDQPISIEAGFSKIVVMRLSLVAFSIFRMTERKVSGSRSPNNCPGMSDAGCSGMFPVQIEN